MSQKPQILQRSGLLVLVILGLLATSCGTTTTANTTATGDVPSSLPAVAEAETTTTEAMQLVTINVAARNSIEASPLWIADSLGLFEKYGIDVEFFPVTNEREVVEALGTGDANVGVLSSTSVMEGLRPTSRADLTPVVYIDATDVLAREERGSLSLIAPIESGDLTGCDLEGARIAVDSERSASAVAVREMVIRDGCDPALVDFVAMSRDDIASSLRSVDVVAAAIFDPLTAEVLRDNSNKLVANLDNELCPRTGRCPLSLGVFETQWANDHPDDVEAFTEAMHEAMTWIRENELDYRAELVTCCSVTAEDAAGIKVPNFVGDHRRDLASDLSRLQSIVTDQLNPPAVEEDALEEDVVDEGVEEDPAEDEASTDG